MVGDTTYRIGAAEFTQAPVEIHDRQTAVYVQIDQRYRGRFIIKSAYRSGIKSLFDTLSKKYQLSILSGDHNGEQSRLNALLGTALPMHFNQQPQDKLDYIEQVHTKGGVMMIGDGLNDAGALAASDVGVALSDDINVFSPASDAILEGARLVELPEFLRIAKRSMQIIKWAFVFSLFYNLIGLCFALTGNLEPVVAAILMPLSSISIVVFTTLATNLTFRQGRFKT